MKQVSVTQFMGGEYAQMWMIATPTKPGWCRCLWWFFTPAQPASKRTKTLARLPTWLDHQTRSAGKYLYLGNSPSSLQELATQEWLL